MYDRPIYGVLNLNTKALTDLSTAILRLHKELLEYQKQKLEAHTGKTLNPYEMLGMALNHEDFFWLKPLSQMVVEIDLAIERESGKAIQLEAANSPKFDVEKIKMFWDKPPEEFNTHLIDAIQANPDVAFFFSEARVKARAV